MDVHSDLQHAAFGTSPATVETESQFPTAQKSWEKYLRARWQGSRHAAMVRHP